MFWPIVLVAAASIGFQIEVLDTTKPEGYTTREDCQARLHQMAKDVPELLYASKAPIPNGTPVVISGHCATKNPEAPPGHEI